MQIFDKLVQEAMVNNGDNNIQSVIEKELLHHDIIREMSKENLLKNMVFMGGTALRACYGSQRLSEDLDFTGGVNFQKQDLNDLSEVIIERLKKKYFLEVTITEPKRETGNTNSWKIKVITRPKAKHLPAQKINIDICAIPSYQAKPMTLINHYGVDMGTGGLIIQTESKEEILLDKIIAFVLRPNRIKNRDLWDVAWLKQSNVILPVELIKRKIKDHKQEIENFVKMLNIRLTDLNNDNSLEKSFNNEMMRFLPLKTVNSTLRQDGFWLYIKNQIDAECQTVLDYLSNKDEKKFEM